MSNQNERPILSILTPINKAHVLFVGHLLSIRDKALSYGDVEWVIGINNATDSDKKEITKMVSEGTKNARIIDYGNVSLGITRNNLIRDSIGKYILFVDSDDMIDFSMLYIKQFISDDEYDVVFPETYYEVNIDGERSIKTNCQRDLFIDPINNFKSSKLFQYMWGKIIKRSIAERIHFYDCNMFEDIGAFIDMCNNMTTLSILKYPIYIRTKSDLNITNTINENTYRGLEVCVQHWNIDFPDGSMRDKLDNLINYIRLKGAVDEEKLKNISKSYCPKE